MFSMPHFHLPMLQRKKPKNILYRKLQLRETTPFQLKRNPQTKPHSGLVASASAKKVYSPLWWARKCRPETCRACTKVGHSERERTKGNWL